LLFLWPPWVQVVGAARPARHHTPIDRGARGPPCHHAPGAPGWALQHTPPRWCGGLVANAAVAVKFTSWAPPRPTRPRRWPIHRPTQAALRMLRADPARRPPRARLSPFAPPPRIQPLLFMITMADEQNLPAVLVRKIVGHAVAGESAANATLNLLSFAAVCKQWRQVAADGVVAEVAFDGLDNAAFGTSLPSWTTQRFRKQPSRQKALTFHKAGSFFKGDARSQSAPRSQCRRSMQLGRGRQCAAAGCPGGQGRPSRGGLAWRAPGSPNPGPPPAAPPPSALLPRRTQADGSGNSWSCHRPACLHTADRLGLGTAPPPPPPNPAVRSFARRRLHQHHHVGRLHHR
jgi:hypothetical protein